MKQEELCRKLTEMIAETKAEKLSWRLKYRPQREMMLPRSRSRRSTERSGRLMSAMRLTTVTTAEKNSV